MQQSDKAPSRLTFCHSSFSNSILTIQNIPCLKSSIMSADSTISSTSSSKYSEASMHTINSSIYSGYQESGPMSSKACSCSVF
ncbi:hypothetical protein SteCoe_38073 [Stentor coeruleus]|uniref:Uncharacterized protein n=1 Tax=Stentor coeruleus TaxID=5963 RepID=A0A1R2AM68_9CILI|nr:hypothetical protein SteCoe_38073 [Stentor coeruleus]